VPAALENNISSFEIVPLLVRSYSSKSARHFGMKESFFHGHKAKIKEFDL
jgi:hypothetical protein